MPLQLPNLDDRTYNDLVAEALSLIPTYAPEWTNHNPSDPGITLIELFAYLSELLIYRLNRVTDENLWTFLKLLNGPDWRGGGHTLPEMLALPQTVRSTLLRQETRLAVLSVRDRYRAITSEDFERLSTENFNVWLGQMQQAVTAGQSIDEWWTVTGGDRTLANQLPAQVLPLQRAHCVPQRNLDAGSEAERRQLKPGYVSVVILPAQDTISPNELGPQPTPLQKRALWGYLDQRRLLATHHAVVGPTYAPVTAEILVACRADMLTERVRHRILMAIADFLHPLAIADLPGHQGWAFGRDVYISELYQLLENLEEVDYLPDIFLTSACQSQNHCVEAEPLLNREGDPIGLRLYPHHLPAAHLALFSLETPLIAELDSAVILPTLRQAFSDRALPLAVNASITVIESGTLWVINSGNQTYRVGKQRQHLQVYDPDKVAKIIVAPNLNFLPIDLQLNIQTPSDIAPDLLQSIKQQLKQRARQFFHPLYGGPGPQTATDTLLKQQDLQQSLTTGVQGLAGVSVRILSLQTDPARLGQAGILVKAREVIDLRLTVSVTVGGS